MIGTKKSKAIKCDICDLGVRDNYQLKLHMRKHSNQRNFKVFSLNVPIKLL